MCSAPCERAAPPVPFPLTCHHSEFVSVPSPPPPLRRRTRPHPCREPSRRRTQRCRPRVLFPFLSCQIGDAPPTTPRSAQIHSSRATRPPIRRFCAHARQRQARSRSHLPSQGTLGTKGTTSHTWRTTSPSPAWAGRARASQTRRRTWPLRAGTSACATRAPRSSQSARTAASRWRCGSRRASCRRCTITGEEGLFIVHFG